MPHPVDIHVGSRVREARSLKGMSQEQLGVILGISFQQVQKYEKGSNMIGSSRLWDICRALEVSIDFLFDGLDEANPLNSPIPRKTLKLAHQIESIADGTIRNQILQLIKACASNPDSMAAD